MNEGLFLIGMKMKGRWLFNEFLFVGLLFVMFKCFMDGVVLFYGMMMRRIMMDYEDE